MSKKILFITGNKKKVEEIKAITGFNVVAKNLEISEIQALDVEEVAKAKVLEAFKLIGKPVVVDDTGMYIDALNGLPGALVTWFLNKLKPKGIVKLLVHEKNRKATVSTCIAYADQDGARIFTGTVRGKIADSLRGRNDFGYDPIFIPDGHNKTYGEMSRKEKNEISMRKIALLKFKKFLSERTRD